MGAGGWNDILAWNVKKKKSNKKGTGRGLQPGEEGKEGRCPVSPNDVWGNHSQRKRRLIKK